MNAQDGANRAETERRYKEYQVAKAKENIEKAKHLDVNSIVNTDIIIEQKRRPWVSESDFVASMQLAKIPNIDKFYYLGFDTLKIIITYHHDIKHIDLTKILSIYGNIDTIEDEQLYIICEKMKKMKISGVDKITLRKCIKKGLRECDIDASDYKKLRLSKNKTVTLNSILQNKHKKSVICTSFNHSKSKKDIGIKFYDIFNTIDVICNNKDVQDELKPFFTKQCKEKASNFIKVMSL